jgi:hypothetical protein
MNFAHIVVISKVVVKRLKFLYDNFKNGRSAIKIYQDGACPAGASITHQIWPFLAGRQVGYTRYVAFSYTTTSIARLAVTVITDDACRLINEQTSDHHQRRRKNTPPSKIIRFLRGRQSQLSLR